MSVGDATVRYDKRQKEAGYLSVRSYMPVTSSIT